MLSPVAIRVFSHVGAHAVCIRVIEVERTAELNPKIIRLKEELDAERERGLQMWLNLITTEDGLNRNVPTRGQAGKPRPFWRFLT